MIAPSTETEHGRAPLSGVALSSREDHRGKQRRPEMRRWQRYPIDLPVRVKRRFSWTNIETVAMHSAQHKSPSLNCAIRCANQCFCTPSRKSCHSSASIAKHLLPSRTRMSSSAFPIIGEQRREEIVTGEISVSSGPTSLVICSCASEWAMLRECVFSPLACCSSSLLPASPT
jgi:hypothetical protein